MSDKSIAIVTGVGPGTGSAIVRRFAADGFRVIAMARSPDRIRALEGELPDTHAMICDVSSETEVRDAIASIRKSYGSPSVLIHNAVGGGWGTFLEIEPKMLDRNFQVNVMGLLYLAREVAPDMIKAGSGTILVTGNTSAIRGKANFGIDRARSRATRHPCRLRPDRRRDRCTANARAFAGSTRRVLYQAIRDRRRTVAPLQAGPLSMVLPDRASPVRGKMVRCSTAEQKQQGDNHD
jgi:NAD(P)-dependent dehydrogenase (short-subunit alcohol dehydrogenase family)